MSKKFAAVAALAGMAGGAVIGSPYLAHASSCADAGSPGLGCTLNSAIAPFISAIAIGFVAGIAVAHIVTRLMERAVGPRLLRASSIVGEPARQAPSVALSPAPRLPEPPRPVRIAAPVGSRGKPRPTPRQAA